MPAWVRTSIHLDSCRLSGEIAVKEPVRPGKRNNLALALGRPPFAVCEGLGACFGVGIPSCDPA